MNVVEHFKGARRKIALPAGAILFTEGEPGTDMYVLLDGMVDIVVAGTLVELATPGCVLGEMALIDGSPRAATVRCRLPCEFVAIDQAQFDLLVCETPAFARHVMGVVTERLRRMNDRLREAVAEIAIRQ